MVRRSSILVLLVVVLVVSGVVVVVVVKRSVMLFVGLLDFFSEVLKSSFGLVIFLDPLSATRALYLLSQLMFVSLPPRIIISGM